MCFRSQYQLSEACQLDPGLHTDGPGALVLTPAVVFAFSLCIRPPFLTRFVQLSQCPTNLVIGVHLNDFVL